MRVALLFVSVAAFCGTASIAQNPACQGDLVLVRVSQIKPAGSMDGFLKAVAAQKAWYRANGITGNDIVAARVLVPDPAHGGSKYSDTEVMSYHFRPPLGKIPGAGDSAWNAFVKLYQDNADIKSETAACMLTK